MDKEILDGVAEDLFSTLPLIHRSILKKLIKTVITSFEEDIAPPHFEIMKTLHDKGTLHVAEIGERLQIPKPQMTHLIDRLVGMEIVERQTDAADRRIINITLTAEGEKMMEEHNRLIKGSVKEKLSCLTDEELQELSVSLRKLRDILLKL